jgi:hypothetical protein
MNRKSLLKGFIKEALTVSEMKLGVAGRHSFDVGGHEEEERMIGPEIGHREHDSDLECPECGGPPGEHDPECPMHSSAEPDPDRYRP